MGTWIEMWLRWCPWTAGRVVPLVGTWIEIWWEDEITPDAFNVVPLVGTWIEMKARVIQSQRSQVVPLVGTWIEIAMGM